MAHHRQMLDINNILEEGRRLIYNAKVMPFYAQRSEAI